ncbi:MAG: DUF4388 domain-containing protein [Candidatus Latescibacterota bacterium]|nr:MAG: DUF4388 domain-containing protein [Candidatus Latescibacterota bacterium]
MSLEGNLTAFGISEILQLIAVQQKSGMLTVTRQGSSTKLFFHEGKIVSTRDRRRGSRDPVKDYLTRYGVITRKELERLTDIAEKSKLDVTEVIVSENLLTKEAMETHYRNHIQETVHDILTWEQGSYKFIPGRDVVNGIKLWGEFNIEGLLMESMRRIDEYPQILKEFSDGSTLVKKRGRLPKKEDLTSNESVVIGMLSEKRSIDDLVAHAMLPRFEVYEALKLLNEKNLLEVAKSRIPDPELTIGTKLAKRRGIRFRPSKNPLPLVVSIMVLLAAGFWNSRSVLPTFSGKPATDTEVTTAIERNQAEAELRWFLEMYKATHGSYPSTIADLETAGIASASLMERASQFEFRYYLTPDGTRFTLL